MDASIANITLNGEGETTTSTDLWSSILDSVRTDSRSLTTRNVIVLGTPLTPPPRQAAKGGIDVDLGDFVRFDESGEIYPHFEVGQSDG